MNQLSRFRPNLNRLEDRCNPVVGFVVDNFWDMAVAGRTNLRQAISLANASPNDGGNDGGNDGSKDGGNEVIKLGNAPRARV